MCKSFKQLKDWPIAEIGVIISIIFSLVTFMWGLGQFEEINRPYIGISKYEDVIIDMHYQGNDNTNLVEQVTMPIGNFGQLPAYYEIAGDGDRLLVEGRSGILMPDQTLFHGFYDAWPKKLHADECEQLTNRLIRIRYGTTKEKMHYETILGLRLIDPPTYASNVKSIVTIPCTGGAKSLEWYVQSMI